MLEQSKVISSLPIQSSFTSSYPVFSKIYSGLSSTCTSLVSLQTPSCFLSYTWQWVKLRWSFLQAKWVGKEAVTANTSISPVSEEDFRLLQIVSLERQNFRPVFELLYGAMQNPLVPENEVGSLLTQLIPEYKVRLEGYIYLLGHMREPGEEILKQNPKGPLAKKALFGLLHYYQNHPDA